MPKVDESGAAEPIAVAMTLVVLAACHSSAADQVQPSPSARDAAVSAARAVAPAPAQLAPAPVSLDLPDPPAVAGLDPPQVDIDDPHASLARFFLRTDALLRKATREPVRIAVYGDSNGTMDYITGEMRRVLQTAHGDSGHGYIALARPWPWYLHTYVVADYDKDAWSAYTVTTHPTPTLDPWYGQGMIAAQSRQKGAETWVATAPEGAPIGTRATAFEVWYLRWQYGGAFDVKIDGEVRASADTHADGEPHFGFVRVDVPDGPHKMIAVSKTGKPVRLLGAVVDRDEPGFQVDSLGVGSQNCLCVLRESEALDHEIFAHRPYDLIVMHIGSNTWNPAVLDPVVCMKEVVARFRRAVPDVSVMIMTPPDWGEKGVRKTPKWFLRVEDQLREAAAEAPTAFFDFRAAMGGEGSMMRFQDHHMTQGDGMHLNAKGGAYTGARVAGALARAFDAWEKAGRAQGPASDGDTRASVP